MVDIKLIVTDLDGTFLINHTTAHPAHLAVLERARKAGYKFCASTGRVWSMAREIILPARFERLAMTSNGAAIMDTQEQKHIYLDGIENAYIAPILQAIDAAGKNIDVYCGMHIATCKGREASGTMQAAEYAKTLPEGLGTEVIVYDSLEELAEKCEGICEQVCVEIPTGQPMPQPIVEALEALGGYHITFSHDNALDILPLGVSKAKSLNHLTGHYGLKRENVIAFGDNINDIEMIKWAGIGVAMGNADDKLKEVADMVTDTNTNGGIAKTLQGLLQL